MDRKSNRELSDALGHGKRAELEQILGNTKPKDRVFMQRRAVTHDELAQYKEEELDASIAVYGKISQANPYENPEQGVRVEVYVCDTAGMDGRIDAKVEGKYLLPVFLRDMNADTNSDLLGKKVLIHIDKSERVFAIEKVGDNYGK